MANLAVLIAAGITALATCVIAWAGWQTLRVYRELARLTREGLEETRQNSRSALAQANLTKKQLEMVDEYITSYILLERVKISQGGTERQEFRNLLDHVIKKRIESIKQQRQHDENLVAMLEELSRIQTSS